MATNYLLSRPTLQGTMRESPDYGVMGVGLTDTILLIGHADADVMYNPYQVLNIQEAINFLNGDSNSPLVRGLLEAYNNGCKDIWVYPAAPMSEYQSDLTLRISQGFYSTYFNRLTQVYATIREWDVFHIIVPLEAPHYYTGSVDFTNQLIDHCSSTFAYTGAVCMGVLGTRIPDGMNAKTISNLVNDTRLKVLDDDGKFVMIVVGEGLITNPQLSTSYSSALSTQIATIMATALLNRSVAGILLPHVASVVGFDMTSAQLSTLSQAKLNPIVRTTKAKRGLAYQNKLLTDNTLGKDGSDFWSMGQMRLIANCVNQIRAYGWNFIGSRNNGLFEEAVSQYLVTLQRNGYIKQFSLNFDYQSATARTVVDSKQTVNVNVSITPIFGIRNIFFNVLTGPGA